jgi:hypothetical protein
MCAVHQLEIEILRKNVEELSLPFDDNINKEENKKNKKEKNLNVSRKKIITDNEDDDEDYYEMNKIKESKGELFKQKKIFYEKQFDDVFDNIYKKDKKYFYDQRIKNFQEVHFDSIECKAGYYQKKRKNRFNLKECLDIINENDHQSRNETIFEDEFVSSDSYDTDLFNLKTKVGKNFEIKTRNNFTENKENLNEIMKVLKICKNRDNNNEENKELNVTDDFI